MNLIRDKMDKNSFMWIIVSTLQAEIYNHERIRDNHAKNKDKKNVDYLNVRISKYEEAIEILKEAETSKEKALNIGSVIKPVCEHKKMFNSNIVKTHTYCPDCNNYFIANDL